MKPRPVFGAEVPCCSRPRLASLAALVANKSSVMQHTLSCCTLTGHRMTRSKASMHQAKHSCLMQQTTCCASTAGTLTLVLTRFPSSPSPTFPNHPMQGHVKPPAMPGHQGDMLKPSLPWGHTASRWAWKCILMWHQWRVKHPSTKPQNSNKRDASSHAST